MTSTTQTPSRVSAVRGLTAGAVAGVLASLAMGMYAMGGNDFRVSAGTAVLGAVIHMMTGAMYGAVFGLIVSRLRLGGGALLAVGPAYGGLVLVMSAFVGHPLAAAIFDAGDPIRNMAEMAGWGTFAVEHLLFGLALGALLTLTHRQAEVPAQTAAAR